MLPLRDCRGYRSRYINALNRAVRSLTPIAGRGIRLRQSAQGVVIEATAKSAAGVPFDHRFKVSFAANADGGFDLTIRKGSLWRVAGGVAAEQALLLGSGIAKHPTDADAWQVAGASAGALYVSQSTAEDGETPVYMLGYAAIPVAPLAVIAEFTPSQSSSNPAPKVTQRHLGDLLIFEGGEGGGGEVPPAAWCVRKNTVTETTSSGETTDERWQVFAPTWTVGRDTLLPAGMGREWNDLPDSLTSGTLYASLTWEGTATVDDEGNTTVSWTPGTPVLTNDASSIPPDDDPTGTGTSSATPGHRSVIVEIGEFSDEDDTFDQRHVGSIVEDVADGGGGGGGDTPTPGERDPVFLEVRKRPFQGGSEVWCVYLGSVDFAGDFAKKPSGSAPWEATIVRATVEQPDVQLDDGWASLSGATEGDSVYYYLYFDYYPFSDTPIHGTYQIGRGDWTANSYSPALVWLDDHYRVEIPFARGGTSSDGRLTQLNWGIPDFSRRPSSYSGAVIRHQSSSAVWQKYQAQAISGSYEMALVTWTALEVALGYGPPGYSTTHAVVYSLPLDDALIASNYIECVAHSADHVFGVL